MSPTLLTSFWLRCTRARYAQKTWSNVKNRTASAELTTFNPMYSKLVSRLPARVLLSEYLLIVLMMPSIICICLKNLRVLRVRLSSLLTALNEVVHSLLCSLVMNPLSISNSGMAVNTLVEYCTNLITCDYCPISPCRMHLGSSGTLSLSARRSNTVWLSHSSAVLVYSLALPLHSVCGLQDPLWVLQQVEQFEFACTSCCRLFDWLISRTRELRTNRWGLGFGVWGLGFGVWEIGRASCRERV